MAFANSAPEWPWPDSLDALTAAPEYHQLLLENDRVRVILTHIPPGRTTPVHTHRWPSVITILQWSDFIRRDEHGAEMLDTRTLDAKPEIQAATWSAPFPPHTVENVGFAELRALAVEIK